MDSLATLTDNQFARLLRRVVDRIYERHVGGTMFGVDLPTLRLVDPTWHALYLRLAREGARRIREAKT